MCSFTCTWDYNCDRARPQAHCVVCSSNWQLAEIGVQRTWEAAGGEVTCSRGGLDVPRALGGCLLSASAWQRAIGYWRDGNQQVWPAGGEVTWGRQTSVQCHSRKVTWQQWDTDSATRTCNGSPTGSWPVCEHASLSGSFNRLQCPPLSHPVPSNRPTPRSVDDLVYLEVDL